MTLAMLANNRATRSPSAFVLDSSGYRAQNGEIIGTG
jgi:hypothetical protein